MNVLLRHQVCKHETDPITGFEWIPIRILAMKKI